MDPPRLAVCTWSLRPADPAALADRLRALGIDAVQLALNPIMDDPGVWGDAIAALRSAGLTIVSGMLAMRGEDYSTLDTIARTGGVRPDDTWLENLARATHVAEIAMAAEIGLVTFHAGFLPERPDDPERRAMLDRLHLVADAFEQRRVDLAFETGQETADTLVAVLEQLGRSTVGVNFDPANMILYGKGDPVAALRTLAPHVRQIHVKDAVPTDTPGTWGTEVPAGQGAVDWPAFFEVARSLDPPVDFVIEREAGADRDGDIAAARDLVRSHIPFLSTEP